MPSLSAWKEQIKADHEGALISTVDRDGKTVEAQAVAGGRLVGHWLDELWEGERRAKLEEAARLYAEEQAAKAAEEAAKAAVEQTKEAGQ